MFALLKNTLGYIQLDWLPHFKKPFRERNWRYRYTDHYFEVAGQNSALLTQVVKSWFVRRFGFN